MIFPKMVLDEQQIQNVVDWLRAIAQSLLGKK
jgi:hypothetical protein